jgi:long-chain fatty acid transport protein
MKRLYLLLVLLFASSQLFAGGFQINEQGARALSMANAFTGVADNPSAIFFNPAGITQLKGTQFLGGISLISPNTKFIGPLPLNKEWKMDNKLFTPFDFYASHQFSENLSAGLSINNQYGLGTKWPSD